MAERWLAMQANAAKYPRGPHDPHANASVDVEEHRTPSTVRQRAGMRASQQQQHDAYEGSPGRSERAFRTGNERLYEAYNELHALAQDFQKPFDAPAILVVGHQTDGKSGACRCCRARSPSSPPHPVVRFFERPRPDAPSGQCALAGLCFASPCADAAACVAKAQFTKCPCSPRRGTDGLPVQPRGGRHQDASPHHAAHEVQRQLRAAAMLPRERGVWRAGAEP
jgi:hypothetical protein